MGRRPKAAKPRQPATLPAGFIKKKISVTIPTQAQRNAVRKAFTERGTGLTSPRTAFLMSLPHSFLDSAGFISTQKDLILRGITPKGWQVHHKLPIAFGGQNDSANFILIYKDQHTAVHRYMSSKRTQPSRYRPGTTETLRTPWADASIYPRGGLTPALEAQLTLQPPAQPHVQGGSNIMKAVHQHQTPLPVPPAPALVQPQQPPAPYIAALQARQNGGRP